MNSGKRQDLFPSLRELYASHTGKVSDKWSLYLDEYEKAFGALRCSPVRLLEIGIQNGGSLELWSKYFRDFKKIVGCDINRKISQLKYLDERIEVIVGDSESKETFDKVLLKSKSYDIIIDDGSHESANIINNFLMYFPLVEPGGIYVVEDLHCSYWTSHNGGLGQFGSSIEFFKILIDILNYEHWRGAVDLEGYLYKVLPNNFHLSSEIIEGIQSIRFANSLCFIEKTIGKGYLIGDRIVVGTIACVDPEPTKFSTLSSVTKESEFYNVCLNGDPSSKKNHPAFGGAAWVSKKTKISVVVFCESPEFASTKIRLGSLFSRLKYTISVRYCSCSSDVVPEADIYIIQRHPVSFEIEKALDGLQDIGAKVIFDIDDLLIDLPEDNPHYQYFISLRTSLIRQLGKADLVTVSTDQILSRLLDINSDIRVVSNRLDERKFSGLVNNHRGEKVRRILMSGTPTHSADFGFLKPVLELIARDFGETLEFVLFGIDIAFDAGNAKVSRIPFVAKYDEYIDIIKTLSVDLALIPLLDNSANRCKSNIKWLEYSALGIPGIYTHLSPYGNVENWITGVLVPNEEAAWYDAIHIILDNELLRNAISENARLDVYKNWTVSSWLHGFISLFRVLLWDGKCNGVDAESTLASEVRGSPDVGMCPWLPEQRWLATEHLWANDVSMINPISLGFVVITGKQNAAQSIQLNLTLQWWNNENRSVIFCECFGQVENMNQTAQASEPDWLAFIDAGDQLSPDATFRIQQAIEQHPEWQLLYTDEDSLTADGQHVNPHCKPDCNIDYLRSLPYVGGLLVIKKDLFTALGGFDPAADGAEDYDLVLRAWERVGDAGIGHIPEVLYHRLQGGGHCSKSIEEILAASKGALERHLQRLGIAAEVLPGPFPPSTRVRYPLTAMPVVSIIVPTRNQLGMLQRCVESIIEKTRYPHYELLIVDNGSDDPEAVKYLELLAAQEESLGGRLRVLQHPGPFNFSAMNNRAVAAAKGELLLLLNNDTAALHDDWLNEMVSHALRPEVGIVGAKLLFPDGKIQHAGVILGMKGPAEHPFIGQPPEYRGYFGRAMLTQNLSAVTGACLLIAKSLYADVGGLDEKSFQVSYNDIDLCLKVRALGKKIVFTPWAMLLHEGSASQRGEVEQKPNPEKEKRFAGEKMAFYRKWMPQLAFDPAYNRQLSLASTDFLIESEAALTWDPAWRPRPRILVHPADREGCGEYRIISPMRALQQAGRVQGWETMRIFEPAEMARMAPESIVLQRQMEWPQIEALERHKALSKAFRVFEIDDLITNLPVKSLHKAHIHKDIAKRFRKAAGLCNRLVVATEPLAQAYKGFSDEVWVQPNCIEDAVWGKLQPTRRGAAKPRVGWAGGVGHTGDLEMIADVVRDLADEVDWIFFGLCPDALRPYVAEFHGGVPLPQYPAKLASLDLDLALAPLEENPFNEAKSHLRLLEYGILGYPVVCTDIFPYQGDFPVWRVANRYRDWTRTIREAVADRVALGAAGDRLREHVRRHWLLEEHLDDWMKAWLP